ncbi:MAG: hypothetical protein OXG35_21980 [Acidobacteria bacterium]|nr:hypothetical protein [Acidobacteriota bacterium]
MPFADRFTQIDKLTRPDHVWLTEDDACFFLGEYTARGGYAYSATNDLIHNFKKSPDRRGRPEWRYKERDIERAAGAFRRALGDDPPPLTLVPVPPSKARDDPLYDDRMTRMLQAIWPDKQADIRELIVQAESTTAAHAVVVSRPDPGQIQDRYQIDETLTTPAPTSIAIVDDVLTTGAHFRAASAVLAAQFPTAAIVGLFIARRAPGAV